MVCCSNLDRRIRYSEIVIPLEAKTPRSTTEEGVLELNKQLLNVTRENEKVANGAVGAIFGLGLVLSVVGGHSWYQKVQVRDDRLTNLQLRKLEAELFKLEAEVKAQAEAVLVREAERGNGDG